MHPPFLALLCVQDAGTTTFAPWLPADARERLGYFFSSFLWVRLWSSQWLCSSGMAMTPVRWPPSHGCSSYQRSHCILLSTVRPPDNCHWPLMAHPALFLHPAGTSVCCPLLVLVKLSEKARVSCQARRIHFGKYFSFEKWG